jgi:hypothetical protein
MPAIIDDPSTPTMYRTSGEAPYPGPGSPLPANIKPRQVTLRDRQTIATIVPFSSKEQVPQSLLLYLSDQFAKEIEKGDTYPMMETMPAEKFASYWFQNFGAIMLLGSIETPESVVEGKDWSKECLGSFYIKPNYPGRSSHGRCCCVGTVLVLICTYSILVQCSVSLTPHNSQQCWLSSHRCLAKPRCRPADG